MSIISVSSGLVERCSECPERRKNSHRYWPWGGQCHLKVHWKDDASALDDVWEVSFVDTRESMDKWIRKNAKDEQVLFFDCEWSKWDNGIGLIQIATGVSKCKVVIVDCTVVEMSSIRNIFKAYRMVGWATSNDVTRLEPDETKRHFIIDKVTDLQMLISKQEMFNKLGQEEREKVASYEPLDKNGNVQEKKQIRNGKIGRNVWSLDDMAKCFLGYEVKVPLKNHRGWSDKKYEFRNKHIHYAANDVIAVAYIYDKLKHIYEQIKF